jgi:Family of unknown function (DUF5723)
MKIFRIILLLSIINTVSILGQEVQLTNMHLINNQLSNPSFKSVKNISIMLPSGYFEFFNGFVLNEAFETENGIKKLNPNKLIAKLDDSNETALGWSLGSIGISINTGKFNFQAYHQIRNDIQFVYPKELAQLAWQGNAQFIGKNISIGPSLNGSSFHEVALGLGYNWNNVNISGRFKYLNGIGVVKTNKSKLNLTTSNDIYQLDFDTDYELLTSSFVNIDTSSLLNNLDFNINSLSGNNGGFAIDFGASIKINEKLNAGLSVLDIGSINWKNDSYKYKSQAKFQYNGFDLKSVVNNDSISFDSKLDTIEKQLRFSKESTSFNTSLPVRIYANVNYKISEKTEVGGMIYYSKGSSGSRKALGLTMNYKLGKLMTLGTSYSYWNSSAFNIGLNTILNLGPIQLYMITDNILTVVSPLNSRNANFRVGMNLVF